MKKRIALLYLLFLHITVFAIDPAKAKPLDTMTYDWLMQFMKEERLINYLPHFHQLFQERPIHTFLEFGMSLNTKYFLDSCKKVISVETISPHFGPSWMQQYMDLYKGYSHWIPIAFFTGYQGETSWAPYRYIGTRKVYDAMIYQMATYKSFTQFDDFYLVELNGFVNNICRTYPVDVALVYEVNYLRSDLVQTLFGKVPIIVAHEIEANFKEKKDDLYGYSRIVVPINYESIFLNGTMMWIQKTPENLSLIHNMKQYAKQLVE
jgi:hypothetical protein